MGTDHATHLAILVNELVTNAAKHGREGPIRILLGRSGDDWRLAVRNVGRLPAGYSLATSTGFGSKVLLSIAKSLGGGIEAATMGSETEFALIFPATAARPRAGGATVPPSSAWPRGATRPAARRRSDDKSARLPVRPKRTLRAPAAATGQVPNAQALKVREMT